jgi:hypothetical protein
MDGREINGGVRIQKERGFITSKGVDAPEAIIAINIIQGRNVER